MPEFPFVGGGAIRTGGATGGAASYPTVVTAGGSANAKGSWVQLLAATEFDANWVAVQLVGPSIAGSYLVDLGIGAAPEQVIIPDLYAGAAIALQGGGRYLFPLFVPRGSRISARCQCTTGGNWMLVAVTLISGVALGGGSGPSIVSAYGATANSVGTAIDPGGSTDTDSAWTEIAAATDRAHNWLAIAGRFGDLAQSVGQYFRLQIGIGAAPEQVLVPDLHFSVDATTDTTLAPVVCLPVSIPAGSRLTAKVRTSSNTAGDRTVAIKLYGAG